MSSDDFFSHRRSAAELRREEDKKNFNQYVHNYFVSNTKQRAPSGVDQVTVSQPTAHPMSSPMSEKLRYREEQLAQMKSGRDSDFEVRHRGRQRSTVVVEDITNELPNQGNNNNSGSNNGGGNINGGRGNYGILPRRSEDTNMAGRAVISTPARRGGVATPVTSTPSVNNQVMPNIADQHISPVPYNQSPAVDALDQLVESRQEVLPMVGVPSNNPFLLQQQYEEFQRYQMFKQMQQHEEAMMMYQMQRNQAMRKVIQQEQQEQADSSVYNSMLAGGGEAASIYSHGNNHNNNNSRNEEPVSAPVSVLADQQQQYTQNNQQHQYVPQQQQQHMYPSYHPPPVYISPPISYQPGPQSRMQPTSGLMQPVYGGQNSGYDSYQYQPQQQQPYSIQSDNNYDQVQSIPNTSTPTVDTRSMTPKSRYKYELAQQIEQDKKRKQQDKAKYKAEQDEGAQMQNNYDPWSKKSDSNRNNSSASNANHNNNNIASAQNHQQQQQQQQQQQAASNGHPLSRKELEKQRRAAEDLEDELRIERERAVLEERYRKEKATEEAKALEKQQQEQMKQQQGMEKGNNHHQPKQQQQQQQLKQPMQQNAPSSNVVVSEDDKYLEDPPPGISNAAKTIWLRKQDQLKKSRGLA